MKVTPFSKKNIKSLLPQRTPLQNKTHAGKCLILAGSQGMLGASILTATAASRCGAGYVYLQNQDQSISSVKHPDFLLFRQNTFSKKIKFSSIGIGPGLTDLVWIKQWFRELLKSKDLPVVVDAGALDVLRQFKKLPACWIMTPHEGELARLLKVKSSVIQKNRFKYVQLAQKRFGCVVLLKGHQTLVADGKTVVQIKSGNAALAKAGTGDVLTGMITGFLSQGVSSTSAACMAAFIHGTIADEWIKKNDVISLMASDLLAQLPSTLKQLRK